MTNERNWYFGWFMGPSSVYAVKFDSNVHSVKPDGAIVVYRLNEDEALWNINKLIRKYPYKEIP